MITYKCDKCGAELDAINMITMQVTETTNLERYELCPKCYKKFKEWIAIGPDMAERDCEHCVHHKYKGCESWECNFERRTDADSN